MKLYSLSKVFDLMTTFSRITIFAVFTLISACFMGTVYADTKRPLSDFLSTQGSLTRFVPSLGINVHRFVVLSSTPATYIYLHN